MPKIPEFFSLHEVLKPSDERVFHNNSTCPTGRDMPVEERRSGTCGYRLCPICMERGSEEKNKDNRATTSAIIDKLGALNLEARLQAHGWHLPVPGIVQDFVPGEIMVIAENSITTGTRLTVEINSFTLVGEVLSCRTRDAGTHEVHISIRDTDAIGLRRTPRFPVNLPARVHTSSFAEPIAATITDISGDGLGLETTVKLPSDATLAIESETSIALGVVKYCREAPSQRYRIGVKLHHILTNKPETSGGSKDPTPKRTRWLSFVPKLGHG